MAEVRLEVALAHPPERVWQTLTDARLLSEWFMPTDLEPQEGTAFTLQPGTLDGFLGPVAGELTEVVPSRRMVMLWQGEKLHTRVVWELAETAGGCQVQVVQSGFIGAPATLRRRALRATYQRLFAEQLPEVLDRLAAEAQPDAPAVPRQRLPPAAVTAVAAGAGAGAGVGLAAGSRAAGAAGGSAGPADPWPGGPTTSGGVVMPASRAQAMPAEVSPAELGEEPEAAGDQSTGDQSTGDLLAGPAPAGQAAAGQAAGPAPGQRRVVAAMARWGSRLAVLPAWGRALAVGAAAAVLAIAVLAAISPHSISPPLSDGQPGGEGDGRLGPGTGLQPGAGTSPEDELGRSPAGGSGGSPAGGEPGGSSGAAPTPGATDPGGGPLPGQPEATTGPGAPAAPVLAADLATASVGVRLGLLNLGGLEVTVTVSNPGPGDAAGWEVSMDVGDQAVTDVTGVQHRQEGTTAVFTPAGDGLAAGTDTQFSFRLSDPVLLGSADEPTDCTIDGRPCG